MTDYRTSTLAKTLRLLVDKPFLAAAVQHLSANSEAINAELGKAVVSEIPAFSESRNPRVLPDLARHGPQHTAEILRLLSGGSVGDFAFVREHAHRRAEQRFPLEATLHAYRCGHRVFSRWMREAILTAVTTTEEATQAIAAVADFAIDYTDTVSTIAAGEYLAQTQLLADVAGDQRAQLLTILLDGYDESDVRVAKILRSAGYLDHRQSFCVVLATSVDAAEMQNPARARRLADFIDKTLQDSSFHRVIDIRDGKVTIIISAMRRISGWTAPSKKLASRVTGKLARVGNAALIGVSNDVPSTSQIPLAHREAALALEIADVTHRVVQISEIPLQTLLLHLAGDRFHHALPAWGIDLFDTDDKRGGILIETLRAYADADMNVLRSAELLAVHPNTVYARLQKILDITGMDAKRFHMLNDLLTVVNSRPFAPDLRSAAP